MKNMILAVAFALGAQQVQADDLFAQCITEFPSTSFVIETVGDKVILNVYNHNGNLYAPFWDNLLVPNDLNLMKKESEFIMKLEPALTASWKKSDCQIQSAKVFTCMGSTEKVTSNGIEMTPWAVYSSSHTDSSFAGTFESIQVAYRFYTGSEGHQIVMKYETNECAVSAKPFNIKK